MESTIMEREQRTESVSVMERERTMRNLVDMQRKVEERHHRDRERQLLRVRRGENGADLSLEANKINFEKSNMNHRIENIFNIK